MKKEAKAVDPNKRTTAQNRRIWVLVGDLVKSGLQKEDAEHVMRDIVKDVSGQESSSKLTKFQAADVIEKLTKRTGGKASKPWKGGRTWKAQAPKRPYLKKPTPKEKAKVEKAVEDWRAQLEAKKEKAPSTTKAKPKKRKSRAKPITPKQLGALNKVKDVLGIKAEGYKKFCHRTCGKPWPQTVSDGIKVYEGLEAMLLRRYKVPTLEKMAKAVLLVDGLSPQDRQFAQSILDAIGEGSKLGAGAVGILVKLSKRYGKKEGK